MKAIRIFVTILALLAFAFPAMAAIDSGSDGSDGSFHPVKGMEPWDADDDGIVFLRPETLTLSDARTIDGRNGIFNWTSVHIPSDIRVVCSRDRLTSSSHNPPYYFLAQSTILIEGELEINGDNQGGLGAGHGAPGGFDGSAPDGRFQGPVQSDIRGSFDVFPPTGGGGDQQGTTIFGAGGAGAITLVADESITITSTGRIEGYGGNTTANFDPGGGPGSVRLVSQLVEHNGFIEMRNGQGRFTSGLEYGPIRIEAFEIEGGGTLRGHSSVSPPGTIFYESSATEPRLFIDRLEDMDGDVIEFPDWDPADPAVHQPLVIPAAFDFPFTVVVRAENIAEGREVRVIAPASTRTGLLSINPSTSQNEAAVLFDGANDFGQMEEINTIYAELVIP